MTICSKNMCFNVSCQLISLFFLVFRTTWTWLTETCTSVLYSCCGRESFPLLRLSPWSRWCPGCPQRHPLGAQDRSLPNAFPCVLVEALLTQWRRRPCKLGTIRQAGGAAIQVRASLAGMIGRKKGDWLLQSKRACSR